MTTSCRTVRRLLPLHVGGDLDVKHGAAVDQHLDSCLTCFREYRSYLEMRERMGVLADEPAPDDVLVGFTDEVMARVALGEKGPAAEIPGRRMSWRRMAAAAAVVVALGTWIFGRGLLVDEPVGTTGAPTTVAEVEHDPMVPTPARPVFGAGMGGTPVMAGQGGTPVMMPVIFDENGKLVADPTRQLRERMR